MPVVNTITKIHNIVQRLSPTTEPQLIYTPIPWENSYTNVRGLLKTLLARSEVKSLETVTIPDFEQPPSQADRYLKVRDLTWTQPRYQLDICMRKEDGPWFEFVSVSIQNHQSLPYMNQALLEYMSDGLAFAMAEETAIGAKFKDVGYGLPDTSDVITVFGEVHEELILQPRLITSCTPLTWNLSGGSSVISGENLDRVQLLLVNAGDTNIWVSRSETAEIGKGAILLPGGSFTVQDYYGPVAAIAEGSGLLTGEACS
ncbi:MAG: hypothetical protein ACFCBU_01370 [Cyanophyceae cyanobacterium]